MLFFKRMKEYKIGQYISRLLTALFIILICCIITTKELFTEISYYNKIDFLVFICCVVILFVFMCLIKNEKLINIFLLISAELYFICAAIEKQEYMFSFGLCLTLCILIVYFNLEEMKLKPNRNIMWGISIFLIIVFTLFVGIICCLYYKNYRTPCYDFGLFSQMFYYMKETGECLITCERDVLLNHFAVHFSPIYYLLLPMYALFPSPCTLLVLQAFIVASGGVPLVLICKHYNFSNISALLFSICYISYPAFLGGCFWYLHENCFLAPLILWYIFFSEKARIFPTILFALLTLSVKEDAAVYVAVIALYFIFARKNYKCNLFILIFSVGYFILVTQLMSAYGEGIMSDSRYGDYIYDDGGIFTVIKAVIQNPVYAIHQIFKQEKLLFVLQMSVPLCFLPFVIKKPQKLVLLIPFILVNLMTDYEYQHDIGFQYAFGSGSILFYLAVTNYSELGKKRAKTLLCAVLCSVIVFAGGHLSKITYFKEYIEAREQRETITSALELIPQDASVASSTFLLANLSQRKEVYELETTKKNAEYVVLDLRRHSEDYSMEDYMNDKYTMVFYEENIICIFKNRM